jgi:hypothetical protein
VLLPFLFEVYLYAEDSEEFFTAKAPFVFAQVRLRTRRKPLAAERN